MTTTDTTAAQANDSTRNGVDTAAPFATLSDGPRQAETPTAPRRAVGRQNHL